MSLNVNALPVSIGGIVADFDAPATAVGTAIVAHSVAVAGFTMLGARLGQKFGSLRVFRDRHRRAARGDGADDVQPERRGHDRRAGRRRAGGGGDRAHARRADRRELRGRAARPRARHPRRGAGDRGRHRVLRRRRRRHLPRLALRVRARGALRGAHAGAEPAPGAGSEGAQRDDRRRRHPPGHRGDRADQPRRQRVLRLGRRACQCHGAGEPGGRIAGAGHGHRGRRRRAAFHRVGAPAAGAGTARRCCRSA